MEPMNNPAFRPFGKRVLVLPKEKKAQEVNVGDYTIETQKDLHEKPAEGTVIVVGRECIECVKDQVVLFGKFAGYEQTIEGVEYLILQESEILGEKIATPFDEEPTLPLGMGTIVL